MRNEEEATEGREVIDHSQMEGLDSFEICMFLGLGGEN